MTKNPNGKKTNESASSEIGENPPQEKVEAKRKEQENKPFSGKGIAKNG